MAGSHTEEPVAPKISVDDFLALSTPDLVTYMRQCIAPDGSVVLSNIEGLDSLPDREQLRDKVLRFVASHVHLALSPAANSTTVAREHWKRRTRMHPRPVPSTPASSPLD